MWNKIKEWEPDWVVMAIVIAILVLIFLAFCGCQNHTDEGPDSGAHKGLVSQEPEPAPLTVFPHPKFGFELVLIPAGTQIDGFTTLEPGLYVSGKMLEALANKMAEMELKPRAIND